MRIKPIQFGIIFFISYYSWDVKIKETAKGQITLANQLIARNLNGTQRNTMTELKGYQWNSVVVGRWNPAILTPKGISKYIFEKPEDEPFEVYVPLDAAEEPFRVKIDGMLVQANFDRLAIECETCDYSSIEKARIYCCKAIASLPKTPLTAAGFNLRYMLKEPSSVFLDLLEVPLDNKISDKGLSISGRSIRRSINWENGLINMKIQKADTDQYSIELNYHKNSTDINELSNWLGINITEVENMSNIIIEQILDIKK